MTGLGVSGARAGLSAARNVEVESSTDRGSVTTPPRQTGERTALENIQRSVFVTQSFVS